MVALRGSTSLKILIKSTANSLFGLGHVSRMSCLARQLAGNEIYFQIDCVTPIDFISEIEIDYHTIYENKFPLPLSLEHLRCMNKAPSWSADLNKTIEIIKNNNVDIVVCDLPAINQSWINEIRKYSFVVVFDDLPVTNIQADLIVNPNNARGFQHLYSTFKNRNVLIGQEYNPVNQNYSQPQCNLKTKIEAVLVYMGSSVSLRTTTTIIKALIGIGKKIEYVGEHSDELKKVFGNHILFESTEFVQSFHPSLIVADICIGACGVAYWERCHHGVPSLILKTAENQQKDIEYLLEKGAILTISEDDIEGSIKESFGQLQSNPNLLVELSKKSYSVVKNSYATSVSDMLINCFNGR